ncbi:MAG: ribonuclease P protein component [Verrucomicrobia bacterium]|nr:ribonuclease P protein component [Verrucomicrobiota bacterium]MBI3869885.1 ribonuclease P protein component [Verrucomicrobiota bacterium]
MPSPSGASQSLPARRRIKRNSEFVRIKARGRRLTLGCLIVNWVTAPRPPGPRLGVVVSKRVGNAVERNRAKRVMREVFRRHQDLLPTACHLVLIARPSIAERSYGSVERDFLDAMKQVQARG